MWLFAGVVICRVYLIFCRRLQPLFLWDGLACGAMAYYAGFFFLHMVSDYYLAPADVIAILYTGRLVFLSWEKMRLRTKAAALSVFLVVFFQFAAQSAYRVWERKNLIIAKADIATLIQSRYDHAKGRRLKVNCILPSGQV